MVLRLIIGFLIGFTFAACDRYDGFYPGPANHLANDGPTQNPVIVCCLCSNNCQPFPGPDCPPGWAPKQPGKVIMN